LAFGSDEITLVFIFLAHTGDMLMLFFTDFTYVVMCWWIFI